jgi:hypothetical protein
MAAFLRHNLIFELNRIGARALQRAYRMTHVERIAEARVRIDDKRQVHCIANARRMLRDFREAHEAEIRHAERHVRHARAGDVDRLEAEIGGDARAHCIERAGQEQAAARVHPFAKGGTAAGRGSGHGFGSGKRVRARRRLMRRRLQC